MSCHCYEFTCSSHGIFTQEKMMANFRNYDSLLLGNIINIVCVCVCANVYIYEVCIHHLWIQSGSIMKKVGKWNWNENKRRHNNQKESIYTMFPFRWLNVPCSIFIFPINVYHRGCCDTKPIISREKKILHTNLGVNHSKVFPSLAIISM